jgi:putrescine transport system ATP-binding protein
MTDTSAATGYLVTERLTKRFDKALAVDEVSLSIAQGEIFALLGSSGCGKSTLLRMLAGFDKPTSGRILLGGQDVARLAPYERPINMMFQSYALFPHLTVWDNIAFGLKREGMPKAQIELRVAEMLKLVQLADFAKRKPHQLSGGQQQRVALARSLAKKPQLLLLDEPLGALDKKLREQTQFELVNIIESVGVTCVMVTHDQEEAMTMASRIAVMSQGKVLQVGTPKEIYDHPNCRFVADFIGNINLFDGRLTFAHSDSFEVTTDVGVMSVARNAVAELRNQEASVKTPVSLAIRPEKIQISKVRPNVASNLFGGTVVEIAYFGSYSTFIVVMDGSATRVKITTTNSQRASANAAVGTSANVTGGDLTWGDVVFFWWDETAPVLLTH